MWALVSVEGMASFLPFLLDDQCPLKGFQNGLGFYETERFARWLM
jgi:hypothetical protein